MWFRNRSASFILILVACLSSGAAARVQAGKAELTGAVRDQNGRLLRRCRPGQRLCAAVERRGATRAHKEPGC